MSKVIVYDTTAWQVECQYNNYVACQRSDKGSYGLNDNPCFEIIVNHYGLQYNDKKGK